MEIITEITTNQLLNIMKEGTQNEKIFCENIENNYNLFDKIINVLINYGYDITYLSNDIYVGSIKIFDIEDIKQTSKKDFGIFEIDKDNNIYLAIAK